MPRFRISGEAGTADDLYLIGAQTIEAPTSEQAINAYQSNNWAGCHYALIAYGEVRFKIHRLPRGTRQGGA